MNNLRSYLHKFDTFFEAEPALVLAWLTPFRTHEQEDLYDMPRFTVHERTATSARASCANAITVEEHEFELDSPFTWSRRTQICDHRGKALAIVVATESVEPNGVGCLHKIQKKLTPATPAASRALSRDHRSKSLLEKRAYQDHAQALAQRVRRSMAPIEVRAAHGRSSTP